MDADLKEVRQLAADLGRVNARVLPQARGIVEKVAIETKKQLRSEAEGQRYAPNLPYTINYDIAGLTAEIGPSLDVRVGKGKVRTPASLAFFYYGNSRVGPMLKDPIFALKREAEKADEWFAKLGQAALR